MRTVIRTTAKAVASSGLTAALLMVILPVTADDIYVYPAKGQSDQQLAEDRYACHLWAVNESDFDPSRLDSTEPIRTVRVPVAKNKAEGASGKGAVAGAVAGGIIGAHDSSVGQGAIIGTIIGTIAGAAIEQQGHQEARQEAREEARRQVTELDRTKAERALRRSNYRRALSACLEGRDYVVR